MAFPTTVLVDPAIGVAGMPADSHHLDVRSRLAAADITPGLLVVYHATDSDVEVRHPATTTEVTAQCKGIAMWDAVAPANPYVTGDPVPVIARGVVWVKVEVDVTPDDPVFVRFTAATNKPAGGFRIDADTDKAVQLTRCRYLSSASAGGLAKLDINLP